MLFDSFEAYDVQAVRKESRIQTYIENILVLLDEFGSVPVELKKILESEVCIETLKEWLKLAAKAESIEDFQAKIKNGRKD